MGIEFHCSKCGKLIRAPGKAGGQRGKCPYCKESVYIPTPLEEIEEIPLAPIDKADEDREQRLQEETRRLTTAINREEPGKYDTGEPSSAEGSVPLPRELGPSVPELVNEYLSAMAESNMDRANAAARQLKKQTAQAKEHVQRLMVDEMPPVDLSSVPIPVYKGFLRSLLELL